VVRTRRDFFRAGAALTAGAWVAPSVTTLDRVAASIPSANCETPTVASGAVYITPPTSTAEGGALDSNTDTYVWWESGPFQLASPLRVNRTTPGTFGGTSDQNATIPAGTWACSYFVHGDRLDDNGVLTGSLSFTHTNILGLIYQRNQLLASSFLEAGETTYVYGPMEGNDSMTLTLGATVDTLSWSMRFGPATDQVRVEGDFFAHGCIPVSRRRAPRNGWR